MQISDLKKFLPAGAFYTELKAQENRSMSLNMLNGSLTGNSVSSSSGIMCRTYMDGFWGMASSVTNSSESMHKVIAKAVQNSRTLSAHMMFDGAPLPANPAQGEHLYFTKKPKTGTNERIELLKALDAYILEKYPELNARGASFYQLDMEKHIVTSDGGAMHTMTPRAGVTIWMKVMHEGVPIMHWDYWYGMGEYEDQIKSYKFYCEQIDLIHEELMKKKAAVHPRGGSVECILGPRLAGILAHEAIGHTTEADRVLTGSIAGEYLNQAVASELITLIDVAHTWQGEICPIPVFIDDEGTAAEDTMIIENGILKGYMHNKESAMLMNLPLTGNARGYQYSDEPLIRMRNTMIKPGVSKLEEMIASVEDGYYLIESGSGQADKTSEFMFGVAHGYEIKNGKLARPIKECTISGVAFDLLKTVQMVSDDLVWVATGFCGKKQMIPVGMGGPAIKCTVTMGGRS
jgi:TldD protein